MKGNWGRGCALVLRVHGMMAWCPLMVAPFFSAY